VPASTRTPRPSSFALVIAPLLLLAPAGATAQAAHPFAGTWQGTLSVQAVELRIVFHIHAVPDGGLTATMDSPDQGATGIAVSGVTLEHDTVRIQVAAIRGTYVGTFSADGDTLHGTWSQGAASLPLDLVRVPEAEAAAPPERPQEPKPPYPYRAEDVRVENPDAGVTLAGTLTIPRGTGPFPGVVLVTGSGPQDRNETLLGHKPFLILADHLTRQGIAVLRYDDRGVGGSTGDFGAATSEDFTSDALAALSFLRNRPEVDPNGVGIIGHSEGGLIAPIAAVRSDAVKFIVMLAGPAVRGDEIILYQGELIARAAGVSEKYIELNQHTQRALFKVVQEEPDTAAAAPTLREILQSAIDSLPADEREKALQGGSVDAQIKRINSPWFRFFLTYDPRPTLERVRVPTLALFGEKDMQVPDEQNAAPMRAELADDTDATVTVLPGLNHLFQTAETGAPTEYARIAETMSPTALNTISRWILDRFGPKG